MVPTPVCSGTQTYLVILSVVHRTFNRKVDAGMRILDIA